MTKQTTTNENTSTTLTPYAATKLANVVIEEAGLKAIPPQMMYNYTTAKVNAGKKPLIKFSLEEGVDREDLERWVKSYVERKLAKVEVTVEA